MSQTKIDPLQSAVGADFDSANDTLLRWVAEGKSWSGRERNCCFLNTRDQRFADASAISGLDFLDDARAVLQTDWDLDGDIDLWTINYSGPQARFLRNQVPQKGRFIAVRLEGRQCNRDAIGARVEVRLANREDDSPHRSAKLVKSLHGGEGYLSQSSKWLHFGLGNSEEIESVVVHWPGGAAEKFSGVTVDGRFRLVQGAARAQPWTPPSRKVALAPTTLATSVNSAGPIRAVVDEPVPLPSLTYRNLSGQSQTLDQSPNQPILINLWASWCAPCIEELSEFADRQQDVEDAGLRVLAISGDMTDGDADAARALLQRVNWPYEAGFATEDFATKLSLLHRYLFEINAELPVPTSLLLNADGQLVAFYKGRVDVDDVLQDARAMGREFQPASSDSPVFAGRWNRKPSTDQLAGFGKLLYDKGLFSDALPYVQTAATSDPTNAIWQFNLAAIMQALDRPNEAISHLRLATTYAPDDFAASDALGQLLLKQGRVEDAESEFRRALRVQPNNADTLTNLGALLLHNGKTDEAKEVLKRALFVTPGHPAANSNYGILLAQLGELDSAKSFMEVAVQKSPDDPNYHNNLGLVLLRLGRNEAAVGSFRRALNILPDHEDAQRNLRRALSPPSRDVVP